MATLEYYLIYCITTRPNAEYNVVSHLYYRLAVLKIIDCECHQVRGHRNGLLEVIPHPIRFVLPRQITLFTFFFYIPKTSENYISIDCLIGILLSAVYFFS